MRESLWGRVYHIASPYKMRMVVSMATLLVLTGLGLLSPIWMSILIAEALPGGD